MAVVSAAEHASLRGIIIRDEADTVIVRANAAEVHAFAAQREGREVDVTFAELPRRRNVSDPVPGSVGARLQAAAARLRGRRPAWQRDAERSAEEAWQQLRYRNHRGEVSSAQLPAAVVQQHIDSAQQGLDRWTHAEARLTGSGPEPRSIMGAPDEPGMLGVGDTLYDSTGRAVAVVQELSHSHERIEVTSFGDSEREYIAGASELHLEAVGLPGVWIAPGYGTR